MLELKTLIFAKDGDRKDARAVKIEMERERTEQAQKKIAVEQSELVMREGCKSTKCGTPEFPQDQFIICDL